MHNLNKKTPLVFLIFILSSFFNLKIALAKIPDIKIGYTAKYYLQDKAENTEVEYEIILQNMRSDIYPQNFSIGFPKNFPISNLKAASNGEETQVNLSNLDDFQKITVEIKNPKIGKGEHNRILLRFKQKGALIAKGNIWEAIFPTVNNDSELLYYNIQAIIPPNSLDKLKLSIAKPKPTKIVKNVVYWDNVQSKVVYAVFGPYQIYETEIDYELKNQELKLGYLDIALPPDTLFQKPIIQSLEPEPKKITIDSDGNYLARYFLKPKEEKFIKYKAYIIIYPNPRQEILKIERKNFEKQKKYLLKESKYWKLNEKIIPGLTVNPNIEFEEKVKTIYDFVINTLEYDFQKVENNSTSRQGALAALNNPTSAVCTEYTDLFIAIARENGIYTREIQGYGYTENEHFRPLSKVLDILHTWPEYYNPITKRWYTIDPTWEDTSKIDYFNSLDLNHITFVIHGKDAEYPYSPGSYKINKNKVININPTNITPKEKEEIEYNIKVSNDGKIISSEKSFTPGKLKIKNIGNITIFNHTIKISANNIKIEPSTIVIERIVPYQELEYNLKLSSNIKGQKTDELKIISENKEVLSTKIEIIPLWKNYLNLLNRYWIFLIITVIIIFIPFFFSLKYRNR